MATTSILTGTFTLPNNAAPESAVLSVTLSAMDTDQNTGHVLPDDGSFTIALVAGAIPAGQTIWQNTAGLRGTHYRATLAWTASDGRLLSRYLGSFQVGDDASYDMADLLDQPPIATLPEGWYSTLTQAQYDAAITARDEAVAAATLSAAYAQTPEDTTVPGGSGYSALHYAAKAGADALATAADRVQTGLDAADAKAFTRSAETARDEAQGAARAAADDALATAADRVQTGLDATATAADRVQTGLDATATAADRVQTGLDAAAAETARAAAEAARDEAVLYDGIWFDDFSTMQDDISRTYANTTAGKYIRTRKEGFAYQVAASGASDQHVTTAGGVKLYVQAVEDGSYPLAAFGVATAAGLASVITAMDGKLLDWGSEQISVAAAVSATITHLRWRANGARITYTSATDIASVLTVVVGVGEDHSITGSGLTVDCSNNAGNGITISQPLGDVTATLRAENLGAVNTDLAVGAAASAQGIYIRGGWGLVDLHRPRVKETMMRSGAGVPGSKGVQGLLVAQINATAGAYPLNILITAPEIDHVYCNNTAQVADMDGISILANPDVDLTFGPSSVRIINPTIRNCWGRDIKAQAGYTHVSEPTSYIDEGPATGKQHAAIDIQTGPGTVVGGSFDILNHIGADMAGIVRFSSGAAMAPCVSSWRGGSVTLRGTAVINNPLWNDCDANERMTVLASGVTVSGAIRNFGYIRTNGLDLHTMVLDGIVANLTDALVRTEARSGGGSPYRSQVVARNCINLGSTVPVTRQSVAGVAAWCIASADACVGFSEASLYSATAATGPAGKVRGVEYPIYMSADNFGYVQGKKYLAYSLANGANVTLPEWGASGSCLVNIKTSAADRNAYALLSTDSGGIVNVSVGTSYNIGAAADPGSGSYRVWRSGTQLVLQNNSGATRYFTVEMSG